MNKQNKHNIFLSIANTLNVRRHTINTILAMMILVPAYSSYGQEEVLAEEAPVAEVALDP